MNTKAFAERTFGFCLSINARHHSARLQGLSRFLAALHFTSSLTALSLDASNGVVQVTVFSKTAVQSDLPHGIVSNRSK
jgi:hypothetical protein